MATRFGGDPFDFGNMTDDEIREVVMDQLRERDNLDPDDIEVRVRNGAVTLSGRVGTDAEVRVASAVLDDFLGLEEFSNELVVDELRRGTTPEAGEDDDEGPGFSERMGDPEAHQSDTAEHLVEDLEGETFGTEDVGEAIREAMPYSPPDRPGSDGYGSGENH